jgi:imidazolonepropionase-like amidohydrolase
MSRAGESGRGNGSLRRALCVLVLASACGGTAPTAPGPAAPSPATPSAVPIAITNGTLIDGTGAAPVADAVVVTSGDRIVGAGPRAAVAVPAGARVVDVRGGTILPGFINAHVHEAFDAPRLRTWAQAGVTTVRDMNILRAGAGVLESLMTLRRTTLSVPENARLVSVGFGVTVHDGYGDVGACIATPEEARQMMERQFDLGVDLAKVFLEPGIAGVTDLPLLPPETIAAVVAAAHGRGKRVTAHVTRAWALREVFELGVDDAAHMPHVPLPDDLIQEMVASGFAITATLTVHEAYGALPSTASNLGRFVAAGGQVALGNDYSSVPANGFDHFELGMPMHEITRMHEAGMTPAQIIVAATRTAARVCGLERDLGVLAAGRIADVLVVDGDPLSDLAALTRARLVVHDGVIIRGGS